MDQAAFPQVQDENSLGSDSPAAVRSPGTDIVTRPREKLAPGRIFVITIAGIALAELVAMIVVYNFKELPFYEQTLIDMATMVVIIFPLLYFLSFKPLLEQIHERRRADKINRVRLKLHEYAVSHKLEQLLQATLDEIEGLTGSKIGFFHFLEGDQVTLWLQAWSTNTLNRMCTAEGKNNHYPVDKAGVWVDCIRQRRPVTHNDFASLTGRKGLPDGHAPILRELCVPVIRAEKIVAVLGVGNKPEKYTAEDEKTVSALADYAWDIIENVRSISALARSEEKFRTLVEWTLDWEKWIDQGGRIVYCSPSCETITGYAPVEFIDDPDLLVRIVHPEDRKFYNDHIKSMHDASAGPLLIEYRVVSRDGGEHWIEHVCRPLFGTDGEYLGRRISNRDITLRKQSEAEARERTLKMAMLDRTIHTIQTDIARDLHDTLGQNISFLRMNLEHMTSVDWDGRTIPRNQLQNMTRAANESYELIRAMLAVLQLNNSTEPLNLFRKYAEQVADRSQIRIEIQSEGKQKELSATQIRQLFYIFREALSNSEKYANPKKIVGKFNWQKDELVFDISDNGRGFEPAKLHTPGHYGLTFMRERAGMIGGTFSVESAPEMGTRILVRVPYEQVSSAEKTTMGVI